MIHGLLQPYIDLDHCDRGPLFSVGINHYWQAFQNLDAPPFMLQRTLPNAFRTNALREIGCGDYVVEDPRDLPRHLRSDNWSGLCDALDRWADLSPTARSRLIALLHALCFYRLIERLVPAIGDDDPPTDLPEAELTYLRASALYVIDLPTRVADYGHANLDTFIRLANFADIPPQTGFNAAIKVFTHLAKNGAPAPELTEWNDRAMQHLNKLRKSTSDFDYLLCESRFHRAAAFIPMRTGDRVEVVRVMDLAEEYANALTPKDDAQDVLHRENLHPLLESRTKEAIWLGDLDAALVRATQVTRLDPFEARGWLELGEVHMARQDWDAATEAYCTAALIGPPASAIARHMIGVCMGKLDRPAAAAFMLKSAIDIDPGAISTRNLVHNLPETDVFNALKQWSLQSAEL